MGEFSFENSKLKASRHFSGTFKPSLIIIDIRHADNEARFFGRRYKSVGQTGRCGVSPQEGAARNGVRARGRLSPLKYTYGSFLKPLDCRRAEEFSPSFSVHKSVEI